MNTLIGDYSVLCTCTSFEKQFGRLNRAQDFCPYSLCRNSRESATRNRTFGPAEFRSSPSCDDCAQLRQEVDALRDVVRTLQARVDQFGAIETKIDAMIDEIRALPGGSDYLQAQGRWLTSVTDRTSGSPDNEACSQP